LLPLHIGPFDSPFLSSTPIATPGLWLRWWIHKGTCVIPRRLTRPGVFQSAVTLPRRSLLVRQSGTAPQLMVSMYGWKQYPSVRQLLMGYLRVWLPSLGGYWSRSP